MDYIIFCSNFGKLIWLGLVSNGIPSFRHVSALRFGGSTSHLHHCYELFDHENFEKEDSRE
jgi:hypothetical protein